MTEKPLPEGCALVLWALPTGDEWQWVASVVTSSGFIDATTYGFEPTLAAARAAALAYDPWIPNENGHQLARKPSRGTMPAVEPSETAASNPQEPPADIDGQLRQLAELDAQWRTLRDGLARVHRDRVEVLRAMRATLSVAQIAGLLGVSRQQVHKLLRD